MEARNIVKSYKIKEKSSNFFKNFFLPSHQSFRALDDVSLNVKEGETVGLLGPNGAGKTTLTKCLCGLMSPDEGQILIDDRPVQDSAKDIGVVLGYHLVYHRLSGYDNLKFFAKLYGVKDYAKRIEELADFFDLGNWIHSFVENYSLGMKAKLSLARALIHDPQVLLLDEPTLGLDPRIAGILRSEIKKMDKTILLTTHYMHEANELCDKIAIINKGKIVAFDTPENLKKTVEKNVVIEVEVSKYDQNLLKEIRAQEFTQGINFFGNKMKIILANKNDFPELLLILSKYKSTLIKVNEYEPSLEDVFLKIVGD